VLNLNIVWNRNRNFTEVGAGTALNHYGFTTLSATLILMTKSGKFKAEKIVFVLIKKLQFIIPRPS
jgi:hypothetical protein